MERVGDWQIEENLSSEGIEQRCRVRGPGGRRAILERCLITDDADFDALFADAARLHRSAEGRGTPRLLDQGHSGHWGWLVLEHHPGALLQELMDRGQAEGGRPPADAVFALARASALALAELQSLQVDGAPAGFVHRALSPRCLQVGFDGRVLIRGLYVSKFQQQHHVTHRGTLKGIFSLMSPEQIRGLALDARSDLFALALSLYRFISGVDPLRGDSDFDTLERARNADVPPLDHPLWPYLERCVQRERDARYADAAALAAALPAVAVDLGAWAASLMGPGARSDAVDDDMIFGDNG